jgi:uncharacterized protein YbaR (Trm112 family)
MDIIGWWIDHADDGFGLFDRGVQAILAKELGVSRSTICRDVKTIVERWWRVPCPTCRSPLELVRWRQLEREGKVKITDLSRRTKKKEPTGGHADHAGDSGLRLLHNSMLETRSTGIPQTQR